jgi:hypothetical protein
MALCRKWNTRHVELEWFCRGLLIPTSCKPEMQMESVEWRECSMEWTDEIEKRNGVEGLVVSVLVLYHHVSRTMQEIVP